MAFEELGAWPSPVFSSLPRSGLPGSLTIQSRGMAFSVKLIYAKVNAGRLVAGQKGLAGSAGYAVAQVPQGGVFQPKEAFTLP
jgi:hypothetical protein